MVGGKRGMADWGNNAGLLRPSFLKKGIGTKAGKGGDEVSEGTKVG